ncbi:transketolase [Streptomyces sp. 549]|uniref:transketolase n=1 Tax=Streptomyces sp. 549 TaxID=3049076 RepID=UPI0024C3A804|nr:transketolase [Streptomyces sp. 549]MDK1471996.1 transketolase [Streptomyces sp. 549]
MALMTGAEKHGPAATSTLDALWVLYDRVLRVAPESADDPDRDRFLLSKGHGPMAYYAVLAAKGFLPVEWLPGFGGFDSPLGHHPDRLLVPGVEIGSGSLGHGLPLAVGTALGLRARGRSAARVWVLTGDAELDEGSNHEAIDFAGAEGVDVLHAVVIDNASARHTGSAWLRKRFEASGWSVACVDGRRPPTSPTAALHSELHAAATRPHPGRPHVVVVRVAAKHP